MPWRLLYLTFLATNPALCASPYAPWFAASAEEPVDPKNYPSPTPNTMHEPLAKQFSLRKAARFLDCVSLAWQKKHQCFTCHTNHPYLYARPLISFEDPAPREIRLTLEKYVSKRLRDGWQGIAGGYAVAAATSLAINDAFTTGKLHPLTRKALDHMWLLQHKDGELPWGGGFEPVGDTYFGMMIASIAIGLAPDGYAKTEAAAKGLARIRAWMTTHPPENLHQKAMLLWASCYHDGYLTAKAKSKIVAELRKKQLPDGGWCLPSLGNWNKRYDEKEQNLAVGDGYATGLCILVMRQAGVPALDPAICRGIGWLKSNQRESGRWFTRSLFRDGVQCLTHIGTAFAVMAIQSCKEPLILKPPQMKGE